LNGILILVVFNVFVAACLALDLGFVHRAMRRPSLVVSLLMSAWWILLAASFAVLLYDWQGRAAALEFSTGYLIELSLSADNLFIFYLIFRYFHLGEAAQYRVLFWGIIGAILMRAALIFLGVGLFRRFHWLIYAFGVLLVYSGVRLLFQHGVATDPEKSPGLRLFRRFLPVTADSGDGRFFVREDGHLRATTMLLVLVVVETTDVMFAIDSIPAVLSITLNTFIVYTSNIFAILGLRSLFFALTSLMDIFEFLHYGIACVLLFVGVKMILSHYHPISTETSLATIGIILLITIVASALHPDNPKTD
jgi:tellurite resistance protein TerC